MPIQWKAKAAGETVEREWVVSVGEDDSTLSYTASVSGATLVSSRRDGEKVTLRLSAGTDGATATATLTATTTSGLVYLETAYLPIRAKPNAFSTRVRDVCLYALRPVVGNNGTPSAAELADAQENLDMMLAELAESGGDMGVKLPVDANDILYVSDAFISGIKNGLRVRVMGLYGMPVDAVTFRFAQQGLQRIKSALLPDDRKAEYF